MVCQCDVRTYGYSNVWQTTCLTLGLKVSCELCLSSNQQQAPGRGNNKR